MSMGLQPLIGFDDKLLSLIYGLDAADGIILAGESEIAASKIYFITSQRPYSWKEVGELTSRLMNKRTLRVKVPHFVVYTVGAFSEFFSLFSKKPAILNIEKCKDATQKYWTCSGEKAKRELGFKEVIGFEEGISQTVNWYRKEGWIK
jgi:nucleoside-diphosphate-sugar epimerase